LESLLGMGRGLFFQMLAQLPPDHAAEFQDLGNADRQSASFANIFWALLADLCSALAETILSTTAGLYVR
jgi:hypothetical protein